MPAAESTTTIAMVAVSCPGVLRKALIEFSRLEALEFPYFLTIDVNDAVVILRCVPFAESSESLSFVTRSCACVLGNTLLEMEELVCLLQISYFLSVSVDDAEFVLMPVSLAEPSMSFPFRARSCSGIFGKALVKMSRVGVCQLSDLLPAMIYDSSMILSPMSATEPSVTAPMCACSGPGVSR
jgi:hypothetical protein